MYCIASYCVLCLYLICYLYTNVSTKITRNKDIYIMIYFPRNMALFASFTICFTLVGDRLWFASSTFICPLVFGYTVSEEKNFKYRPIRNKNCLWWPCLLMDRNKMSNLYKGPSIMITSKLFLAHLAKGNVSFCHHLASVVCRPLTFHILIFSEMSNLYRGPSIDASYQLSVHLAKQFQRRRFLNIGQSETRINQ
jgi:hypothetical protein